MGVITFLSCIQGISPWPSSEISLRTVGYLDGRSARYDAGHLTDLAPILTPADICQTPLGASLHSALCVDGRAESVSELKVYTK